MWYNESDNKTLGCRMEEIMKDKKIITVSIITSLVIGLIVYVLFNPKYYTLEVRTGFDYNYASGVLTKNVLKGSFFLNVNFDNDSP